MMMVNKSTKEEMFMMDFHVTNENICVNDIRMYIVGLSSLLKVGDTQSIQMFSTFDTPPESLIIGRYAPISTGATGAAGHGGAVAGIGAHRGA